MNNKTWVLAKTQLKNGEGINLRFSNKGWGVFTLVTILLTIPITLYAYVEFVQLMYDSLIAIDQTGVIIGWGLAIVSVMILFFGIFYIISSFYFSSDIETFLALPVKPRQIVGAKFFVIVLWEYLITAVVFWPILFVYGANTAANGLFYLFSLTISLFIPVIPLFIGAFIVMLVMRFTNVAKNKDLLKVLGGMLAIFLLLAFSLLMQQMAVDFSPEDLGEMIAVGNNSLVVLTSGVFPTVQFAIEALLNYQTTQGLVNLVIFAALSAGAYALLLLVAELVYLKGVIGLFETGSKRKSNDANAVGKLITVRNSIWSYTLNELRLLFRTPIYFLNCVLINLLWPVLFLFPLLLDTPETTQTIMIANAYLGDQNYAGVIISIALATLVFIGGSNGVCATSISREGSKLFVKKYIPVSYSDQIRAKILSGFLLGLVGVIAAVLALVLVFEATIELIILLLVIGWVPILLTSLSGILLDLYNPKLVWDSEQKAVKQNANVLLNMVVSLLVAAITVYPTFKLELALVPAVVFNIAVYAILTFILHKVVHTQGAARFEQLEG